MPSSAPPTLRDEPSAALVVNPPAPPPGGSPVRFARSVSLATRVLVVATMVLLVAGALVTGKKAAMSDATWPTYNGSWYPRLSSFVGGLAFEDSHRIIAKTVGIIMAAVWVLVLRKSQDRVAKRLAMIASLLVIAQAGFGGLVIHSVRSIPISMTHAVLAELFFCCVVALALVTSKGWIEWTADRETVAAGPARLAVAAVPLAFLQVILGSGIRHADRHSDTAFHTFLALHFGVYVALVFVIAGLFFTLGGVARLKRPAFLAAGLAFSQALLGVLSYFANRARQDDADPFLHHVTFSTLHLAFGAALLGTLVLTAMRAGRLAGFWPQPGDAPSHAWEVARA